MLPSIGGGSGASDAGSGISGSGSRVNTTWRYIEDIVK